MSHVFTLWWIICGGSHIQGATQKPRYLLGGPIVVAHENPN